MRLLRGDQGGLRMFESYPVVTGLDGMAFVGTVSRKDLVREEMERRDQRNVGRERHIAGGRREGGGETGLGTPSQPAVLLLVSQNRIVSHRSGRLMFRRELDLKTLSRLEGKRRGTCLLVFFSVAGTC